MMIKRNFYSWKNNWKDMYLFDGKWLLNLALKTFQFHYALMLVLWLIDEIMKEN